MIDDTVGGFWLLDGDEVGHVHGDHWGVFFPDVAGMLPDLLPVLVQQGALWIGRRATVLPESPEAAVLRFGIDHGIALAVIEFRPGENLLASFWPMIEDVGTHRLTLHRGFVWSNRTEAQLEARFGPSSICFFDHRFIASGDTYHAGKQAIFHLCIHAYLLEPADNAPIIIDDPHWPGREFMQPDNPDDPDSSVTIHREGMAAFFQGKDGDRDDCEFRGPVKAVRELVGGAFGQPAWALTVTVLRDSEADPEDIDLDIVVTALALGDHSLPQVGDDVQGSGWVQGWLADVYGLQLSFLLTAACELYILFYAAWGARPTNAFPDQRG